MSKPGGAAADRHLRCQGVCACVWGFRGDLVFTCGGVGALGFRPIRGALGVNPHSSSSRYTHIPNYCPWCPRSPSRLSERLIVGPAVEHGHVFDNLLSNPSVDDINDAVP